MEWTAELVAEATRGRVVRRDGRDAGGEPSTAPPRGQLRGVIIDSRVVQGGELFVAIKGDRDGHQFVADAVRNGVGAVMVEDGRMPEVGDVDAVVVADTRKALLDLGSAARDRLDADVIGITGSVGKTSTKDLASAALATVRRVTASERSFNNELGVPLTLANAPLDTESAVIEMGARGTGHIALLCSIARPNIALVTAVAAAHTELFGTLDRIAAAKGELVEALPDDGAAVLNGDDRRVSAMARRTRARALTYSVEGNPADVIATDVTLDEELRPTFTAQTPWGEARVSLHARGLHQVPNALAALAVAGLCGVDPEVAARGLADATLSPWRMELVRTRRGALVLNDAYNANPASMIAALNSLSALPARRRIAVLGEMAELGERSDEEHRNIAAVAESLGIELVAVGTDSYGVAPVEGIDAAAVALGALGEGDAVLVKASRVAGLERLAARLVEDP